MSYNIIDEYINFIKKEYLKFYKIILRMKYNKQVIEHLEKEGLKFIIKNKSRHLH